MNQKSWALFCGKLAPSAAAIASLFMVIGILSIEKGTNYFESGAVLPIPATIWAMIAFIAAVIFAIIIPKEEIEAKSPFGSDLLTALPAALGFGVGAIFMVIEFAKSQKTLFLIATLFLLISAAHVLLCETERKSTLLGFAPPIACALLVAVLYFDTSLEMNAPLKVASQCALLPLMLYFTAELRYLLGREIPRLYLALALISIVLSSLCVLAIPVACLTGALENTNCLTTALVLFGTNLTILLKLKRFSKPTPAPDENDTKETDAQ